MLVDVRSDTFFYYAFKHKQQQKKKKQRQRNRKKIDQTEAKDKVDRDKGQCRQAQIRQKEMIQVDRDDIQCIYRVKAM